MMQGASIPSAFTFLIVIPFTLPPFSFAFLSSSERNPNLLRLQREMNTGTEIFFIVMFSRWISEIFEPSADSMEIPETPPGKISGSMNVQFLQRTFFISK